MLEPLPPRDKRLLVAAPETLAAAFGPLPPNTTRAVGGASAPTGLLLWLRPDQWLLLGKLVPLPSDDIAVLDAGARFVEFGLGGPRAADLLAGGCSLDLRERAFAPGTCAQSRIEQVPVILHREALDRFTVIVERPLARYLWHWLEEAARGAGQGESR